MLLVESDYEREAILNGLRKAFGSSGQILALSDAFRSSNIDQFIATIRLAAWRQLLRRPLESPGKVATYLTDLVRRRLGRYVMRSGLLILVGSDAHHFRPSLLEAAGNIDIVTEVVEVGHSLRGASRFRGPLSAVADAVRWLAFRILSWRSYLSRQRIVVAYLPGDLNCAQFRQYSFHPEADVLIVGRPLVDSEMTQLLYREVSPRVIEVPPGNAVGSGWIQDEIAEAFLARYRQVR